MCKDFAEVKNGNSIYEADEGSSVRNYLSTLPFGIFEMMMPNK
jgi:hypothetical protein